MKRADIRGSTEWSIEGGFPEHEEERIELEGDSCDKEEISELWPIIHPMFEMKQSKC